MNLVAPFVSPAGRLAPGPFVAAILIVYVLSFASQMLLSGQVMPGGGRLWAFVLAQAVLLWPWYVLHARRLRDAGHNTDVAARIANLYAQTMVLFLLLLGFLDVSGDPNNPDLLVVWFAFAYVFLVLYSDANFGGGLILILFVIVALAPFVLAIGFSIWAATLPRAAAA